MINKVIETIEKYSMLEQLDKVVVGLSGGADSCALVHILSRLRDTYAIDLTAVHINHGIRGAEADRDEEFSRRYCTELNIKFISFKCNVPDEAKKRALGEEETGRIIRYEKFRETANKLGGAKIAVAHNQNDVSETLMMHLCRGTGLKGLAGISPVNDIIIRPILYCSRQEIEKYCDENHINYCTDSTNLETEYTRNKVRRLLFPWLEKELNTSSIVNIAKTAELLREEEDYIEKLAEKKYHEVLEGRSNGRLIINANKLSNEDIVIRRRVLRLALRSFRDDLKDYSRIHIDNADGVLMGTTGRHIDLPGNISVEKCYNNIFIGKLKNADKGSYEYELILDKTIYVPEIGKYILISLVNKPDLETHNLNVCTKTVDYDKINSAIKFRTRLSGDTIGIKTGRKKLKDLLIDEKIPLSVRNTIPVLACENRIILVEDRVGYDFYINSDTEKKLYIYIWEEI